MPYDAIRDANDGPGVNRSKPVPKVVPFFFFCEHPGLIIITGRLLQNSSGSRTDWPYYLASFSPQTRYRRSNGDCFSTIRGYSSHRARRRFPIPEIPQGWKPDPRRVWHKDPNVDDATASASTRASVLGKRKLTADQVICSLSSQPITKVKLSVVRSSVKRLFHQRGLCSTTYPRKTANALNTPLPVFIRLPSILCQPLWRLVQYHPASLTPHPI
jgi:hypothetical protein